LLAQLLAIADDAVVVADGEQRIVLFNDSAARLFGHPADQVLQQPLTMLLPASARAAHGGHLREFAGATPAARPMSQRRAIQGQRADGSLFDAEASISHVDLEGQTFFTAILRDVSVSRQATRALSRSEARFRGLAATVPVGIFQTDELGQWVYVNERWVAMAGMPAAEAAGTGWLRAVHPSDRARVEQAWRDMLAGRAAFDLRHRYLQPDGTETWVMGRAVANHDGDGAQNGFLGTVTDVTESHYQSLELERAKSEAETAARVKGLFLANMSHEIRTPLNAVIGMTTLLLDTPMSDDQRDFARTIRASSEALLAIVNDILDFSKADMGKLEIGQQAFDLRRCVEDAIDQVTQHAFEKRLNLAYLIEDDTPEALIGDAPRIRQILVNLLGNAVKFTHQGEVFVAVDGQPLADGELRLHIAVHDSGIGIAAEHLQRLFESFSQIDASATRKHGGTGLGLAISRRLAELMGGTVTVQSEPGRGSVFHVELLVRAAAQADRVEFLQRNVPQLAGKRVLIVDDNLSNRRVLTRMALRWGMLPSTLPSALEALDRLRHGECYDIALLDMSMPGLDGRELAVEIRRRRTAEELPIVMMTSLGQRQALVDEHGADMAACLTKPIKTGQLFATLSAVLMGRQVVPPLPSVPAPLIRSGAANKPLQVLVGEDNIVNQRVALRLLQHLGYGAEVVANGLEVIDAVERKQYDVVLLDIKMPEMDGLQAARWIAQRRGPKGRPRLIAMTANAMPGDREAYLAAGMDGYVPKPIDLGDLAAALAPAVATAGSSKERSDGSDEVLDESRLAHLHAMQDSSQPSLVSELIDMFVADSPGHLASLAQALDATDAPQLGRLAHRFLSVTQNIGARRMSLLCMEIENLCLHGRLEPARQLLGALGQERERVLAALLATRHHY